MKAKKKYSLQILLDEASSEGLNLYKKEVTKAWEFAEISHHSQKRLSGEPFISHPFQVALNLINWKLDTTTIVAGLLHDTIEDGAATREDIASEFGEEVALLVDGVTKVTNLRLKGSKESGFVESLRKMILVMAKDLRVVVLKLADRLHNMQTLEYLPKKSQIENSLETIEIYAPLAERLGMGEVKGQLEDLAFPYINKDKYIRVKKESKPQYKKAKLHLNKMKKVLTKELKQRGIAAKIKGREKHLYSLYKKLERDNVNWDFNEVNDIIAFRIIVNSIEECYMALGLVHSIYKPVPSIGVSDYIAQPKPNGYRSIHTKVFGEGQRIIEVQIRTTQMHEQAEFGAAAHWAYTDAKSKGAKDETLEKKGVIADKNKLNWVKQLVAWQDEIKDSKEFLDAVKFDALKERNFIFSPNGDVYDLPVGSTPVDFAYAVHTDLGKYINSAKVNGKIVPLHHELSSGDVVEIVKNKNPKGPYPQWLEFVATTTAKRAINKSLSASLK